jgi:uncharacterized protein YbjT (DUF2867 family)
MSKLTVLVTGATGKQGGAVARALIARGHAVRALTRNPGSPAATALAGLGATPVRGDLTDAGSVKAALAGVDVLFAMGTPFERGIDAEVAQGKAVIAAAREARVGRVVYTSVASADRNTGIPHFDSKGQVEVELRGSGLNHAILAPVYFMENLFFPQTVDALKQGRFPSPLSPHRLLQQVAVADIGAMGALAVEGRIDGRRIELASDELDGLEAARAVGRALGRKVEFAGFPLQALASNHDLFTMYTYFEEVGYQVDLRGLRNEFPEVGWHRFDDWLAETDLSSLR